MPNPVLFTRVTPDLKDRVEAKANEMGVTASDVMRMLIVFFLPSLTVNSAELTEHTDS